MGPCALLCPLCEGHGFSDLPPLLEALLQILSKKVECPSCNTEVAGLPSLVQHITQFHVDRKDNLDQLLDDFNEFVSNGDIGDNPGLANVKHSNDISMSEDFNQSTCFIKADLGMTPSTSSPSSLTAPPSTPSSPSSPSSIDISSSQASLLLSQAPPLPTIKSALLASRDKNVKNKLKVPRWDGREVECDQCGWMFDNTNFLHLHKVLMHSRRRQGKRLQSLEEFTCRSCGAAEKVTFKMFDAYVEHLKLVHNDHRHVCSYCAKAFKLKGSLLVHQRVMHQPCPQGEQQKGLKRTVKHEVIKEEEQEESSNLMQTLEEDTKPLLQPSSSVGFPQLRPPPQHINGILQASQLIQQPVQMHQPLPIHQQVQPLQPIQAKQMVHHQVQRAHQPIRTKYQPIQNVPQQSSSPVFCNLCNMNFSCQTDLLVHTASLHSKFEQSNNINATNATTNSVESTVTNHHKLPPKINNPNRELEKGEICALDNEAGSLPQVKQDNDNISCNICGKTFLVPSHLSVHSRVHEVKQWDCTTCGKKFTTKYFLKKHRRLHTGSGSREC